MGIEGLLIDIDGVLAVSWEALPGAVDALAAVRRAGLPIRLVTNTTSRTADRVHEALLAAGFTVDPDELLTAPLATAAHLRRAHPGGRCLLLSSGSVVDDLDGIDVDILQPGGCVARTGARPQAADYTAVVVGGAGPEFTYEAVSALFAVVLDGVPLVAMHRNVSWKTAEGLQLDSGAYIAAIERAAHVTATVLGKPDADFFATAVAELGVPTDRVAMVGDDIDADVLGAQAAGLTGVLVRTGKFRSEHLARAEHRPDVVLDSFADVPAWLDR